MPRESEKHLQNLIRQWSKKVLAERKNSSGRLDSKLDNTYIGAFKEVI